MAIITASIRLILLYVTTRLSYATGADLSIKIYNLTLYQEYAIHVSRNSSEVISGILNKSSTVISSVIMPVIQFISEDLEELFALSDRIVVMYEGRIAGETKINDASVEDIGLLMAGATVGA